MNPALINNEWTIGQAAESFRAVNPNTGAEFGDAFPVSPWADVEAAAEAAGRAFVECRDWPGARFADFLDAAAANIEAHADAIAATAQDETGLGYEPRLRVGEMGRTVDQLRQAAAAARTASWAEPTIDTAAGCRSRLEPVGPVFTLGPNNFPLAFNAVSGGDFAAVVAAGCPIIAKGHPSHPNTTKLLAEQIHAAAQSTGMPSGFFQLIYDMPREAGTKLIEHPAVAAVTFTGSRAGGLALKAVADRCGKPIYLEMSSVNPVFLFEAALTERLEDIATEFAGSCMMGTGQFCTNPGLIILPAALADAFAEAAKEKFEAAEPGTLLNAAGRDNYETALQALAETGAELVCGHRHVDGDRIAATPTLMRVTGGEFLARPDRFQAEAFGPSSLLVAADSVEQMREIAATFEGNLTGCLYTATDGSDDDAYAVVEPELRPKVGRLLNDKMPTGVAVSSAMVHGGPFPATGHPHFSAIGIPQGIQRFGSRKCYDNVRPHRLPPVLQDKNPGGVWRKINGDWTADDVVMS